jgi:hypothetical protein
MMHDYGFKYFDMLATTMNCGLNIKDDITRAFWYVLNAMEPSLLNELSLELIESSNIDHARRILGSVLANISCKSLEQSDNAMNVVINKLITKDSEADQDCDGYKLGFQNYSMTEYYLTILNSMSYQNKEIVRK